ncbi:MAG TPA: type II secretion system F family protein [Candidatus Babeliales bacterium]|nr:type II secretion system F family protein [Candidatus Babeliales bacterium]HLC07485.1 type II secretion system F family protein [Candidatus Babeliales bacterium]
MPYFKWIGVDIAGTTQKGKQAAYSSQDLAERLLQRGVALLHCKSVYAPSILWPINAKIKGDLFKHKAKLLRAGILLPNVLEIAAQQSCNPIMYDTLFNVSRDIQHGVPFGKAFEKYDTMCDPIVTVMLTAGHESGNLINAVENVSLYFHKQHAFDKNIRSALAMPLLTLLFFVGISFFIFVFIIPRFADMFSSLQQELPALTRSMIKVSDFVRSGSMIYVFIFFGITIFSLHYYFTTSGKKTWNKIIDYIPFIGVLSWQHHICQSLQALALLVNSGVSLVSGLAIVSNAVNHLLVKSQLMALHDEVASGQLLSRAMSLMPVFLPEVVALVHIGEESGTLGQSLEGAALVYSDKLEESLRRFIFLLQPAVIIVLGLLVGTLIFAVYLPIMQLSHAL